MALGSNSTVLAFKNFLARAVGDTEADVRTALGRGAALIAEEARRRCPIESDTPYRRKPGTLRASIGWTFGAPPKGSMKIASISEGRLTATVFAGNAQAFFARFVEFGTQASQAGQVIPSTTIGKRKRTAQRSHPGSAARPFFWPSYRLKKGQVYTDIRAAMARALGG